MCMVLFVIGQKEGKMKLRIVIFVKILQEDTKKLVLLVASGEENGESAILQTA